MWHGAESSRSCDENNGLYLSSPLFCLRYVLSATPGKKRLSHSLLTSLLGPKLVIDLSIQGVTKNIHWARSGVACVPLSYWLAWRKRHAFLFLIGWHGAKIMHSFFLLVEDITACHAQ